MATRCTLCGQYLRINEHYDTHLEYYHKIKEPRKLGGRETFDVKVGPNSIVTGVKYTGLWDMIFKEERI